MTFAAKMVVGDLVPADAATGSLEPNVDVGDGTVRGLSQGSFDRGGGIRVVQVLDEPPVACVLERFPSGAWNGGRGWCARLGQDVLYPGDSACFNLVGLFVKLSKIASQHLDQGTGSVGEG
jgi:hypothetical protein